MSDDTTWTQLVDGIEGIEAVYQGRVPSLSNVIVEELCLAVTGRCIVLSLDLDKFPENPPRKWASQHFNTVRVEISFGGVEVQEMTGVLSLARSEVSLHRAGLNEIHLNITSASFQAKALCQHAYILRMNAYQNQSDERPLGELQLDCGHRG